MYLTDYHSHSLLSPDGHVPLSQMADAALAAGLSELCLTDHCDLMTMDGGSNPHYDWGPGLEQFAKTAPAYEGKLTLKLGLELGVGHVDPPAARRILDQPALDFVIGSIHNFSRRKGKGLDFYYADYSTPGHCYEALDDYFTSMEELVRADFYDVVGHVIYPLRYMPHPVPLDRYYDRIREILKVAAQRGRGMEVNTYRGRTVEDWRPILALYREIGGEIVTVGADAHVPEHVGAGIREAYALIQEMGFSYIATYEKRKPVFHRLSGGKL